MRRPTLLAVAGALAVPRVAPAKVGPLKPRHRARIDDLLRRMTLDEKVGQLTQLAGGRQKALNSRLNAAALDRGRALSDRTSMSQARSRCTGCSGAASVLACAKRFGAYGAAAGGRDYDSADLSDRTLHEVYLPPFHAAVQAAAGTMMVAFNDLGGVPSTGNAELVRQLLRERWGYQGLVVSD